MRGPFFACVGPMWTLLTCVDVLDAVALVREGRTVCARELLPTVILAGARVASQVDTQQAHIVDRQDRELLEIKPAVAVAAHRRADDVGRVAQSPAVQRRAAERANAQVYGQDTQAGISEVVLEGIPPARGNRERIASWVFGKGAAGRTVVACADHEAILTGLGGSVSVVVEPGVEDEVAAESAGRSADRGIPIEAGVVRVACPYIEIHVNARCIPAGGEHRLIASKAGEIVKCLGMIISCR